MTLLNIGFGNMVSSERIVSIVSPIEAFVERVIKSRVMISLTGSLIAAKKLSSYFFSIMLNFFPPPKKSNISITVTIPNNLPEPGSEIGNLLNSCSIITFAVSFILFEGGIETTSLVAIAMMSPSLS